jgi:hypothetical protein
VSYRVYEVPRRSRIYKFVGLWYGLCGRCAWVEFDNRWRQTLDLLELHAQQHKG